MDPPSDWTGLVGGLSLGSILANLPIRPPLLPQLTPQPPSSAPPPSLLAWVPFLWSSRGDDDWPPTRTHHWHFPACRPPLVIAPVSLVRLPLSFLHHLLPLRPPVHSPRLAQLPNPPSSSLSRPRPNSLLCRRSPSDLRRCPSLSRPTKPPHPRSPFFSRHSQGFPGDEKPGVFSTVAGHPPPPSALPTRTAKPEGQYVSQA